MPDTNDTDAILAKVRSGELSAGDAAALIANLHAAGTGRGCRTLLSAAGSGYAGICRTDARCGRREGARDGSAAPSGTYSAAPRPL